MENYAVEKLIGEGTYGIVYRAIEKSSNDQVAIKKFKTVADEQLSKREIQACSMLSHAYIVSYRNSFRHEGLLHLVFDYVPDSMNKLLSRNRRGVNPELAQRFVYQLCQALHYCHTNYVIHRDVKPDNILIDEDNDIRLCDFGVARTIQFEGDPLSDYVATRWYRPPEQELRMDRYSFDADIWSVGCVLMELLTGRPLFPGNTQIDQLNLIQEYLGPLPPQLAARLPRGVTTVKTTTKSFEELLTGRVLPDGTLDFVRQTMQLEPKQRLSAATCLNHPFLKPLKLAEQRERKCRQLEEKQRRLDCSDGDATDSEDGIEEEIPGARHAEAKTPGRTPRGKVGPKPFEFKGGDSGPSTPNGKAQRRHAQRESKAQSKLVDGNNGTDCESDDIQEIIESDDAKPLSPHPPRPTGRAGGDDLDLTLHSPSKKSAGRHRRHDKKDPIEHECYEDDFET